MPRHATGAHGCREASPGKLGAFEDELFRNAEMADVPVVAAVALAYVDGARTVRGAGSAAKAVQAGARAAAACRRAASVFQRPYRSVCAAHTACKLPRGRTGHACS